MRRFNHIEEAVPDSCRTSMRASNCFNCDSLRKRAANRIDHSTASIKLCLRHSKDEMSRNRVRTCAEGREFLFAPTRVQIVSEHANVIPCFRFSLVFECIEDFFFSDFPFLFLPLFRLSSRSCRL